MGTTWSVHIVGADEGIAHEIQVALDNVVAQMSNWLPSSDISRFNASQPGRWQLLPSAFQTVLTTALCVAAETDGGFDPATAALTDLWGFGPSGSKPYPEDDAVLSARTRSGWQHIEQDGKRARRLEPIGLDFSGIAKGYGVDAAAERIRHAGFSDFLIEVGGELRGEGIKADGTPWWVGVERVAGCELAPIRVALHGLSIATSGDYRRNFTRNGRIYSHTIDPRTGYPVSNGVASVTVLHKSCMHADAWATAFTVLGPDGIDLANRLNIPVHMVMREAQGFSERMSEPFAEMLLD